MRIVSRCAMILAFTSSLALAQEKTGKNPAALDEGKFAKPAASDPLPKGQDGLPSRVDPLLDGEPITASSIPPIATDEGFSRYADFSRLPDVINSRRPGELADFALCAAEAERVLGRSHRSGVTAQLLVGLASELAQQDSDDRTASRIQQRVRASYAELKVDGEEIGSPAQKLIAEMKKAQKADFAEATPKSKETFEALMGDVKTAILLRDAHRLKALSEAGGRQPELTPAMRTRIDASIEGAARLKPRDTAEAKALSGLLAQLMASAGAIFYEHSWGGGATYTIYGDQFERSNMPDGWNDVVSSLWVRRGHLVYCFEHVNYGGARCWVLVERDGTPASSPFRDSRVNGVGLLFEMSSHGWNDVISSFRLQPR